MGDNDNCVDNINGDAINDSVKKPTKDNKDAFGLHFRGEYLDSTAVSIFVCSYIGCIDNYFIS